MGDKSSFHGPIEPTFQSLLSSVYSAVLYNLGEIKIKGIDDSPTINVEIAEFNLGLLEMLKEKTLGNLTKEEENLIENLISSARIVMKKYTRDNNDA